MNEIDVRRRMLADPAHLGDADREAIAGDKVLREFHDELLAVDRRIGDAWLAIPVPEGLPDRLLLGQGRRRGTRWTLALAAGAAAVAFGLATQFGSPGPAPAVAMMQHVETSLGELRDDRGVSPEALRASLATFGVAMGEVPYRIRHLGHCVIRGHEGRHFTLDGPRGVVSIVMLPDDGAAVPAELTEGGLRGVFERRGSVVVGAFGTAEAADLQQLLQRVVS